eukprot:14259256-Ditylum_brightwellii.AAC.2
MQGMESDVWNPGQLYPNNHLRERISIADLDADFDEDGDVKGSRSELNSHVTMVVMGRNAVILNDTGRIAEVQPFTPRYKSLESVKILDAVVLYEDQHTIQTFVL